MGSYAGDPVERVTSVSWPSDLAVGKPRPANPRVSLVVPMFNESAILDVVFERVRAVLSAIGEHFEVILVDDGSADDSLRIMRRLHERDCRFKILSLARNFGHQVAISAGLQHAQGDVIAVMDGDLQDPPELIQEFVRRWREGWDVVYAVRRKRKEGWLRRTLYHSFYRLLRRLSSIDIPMDTGDFCLMDRRVVDVLNSLPERNRYVRGLRAWVGFRQLALPYERDRRYGGEPKYTWGKLFRLAFDGILSFSYLPLRLGVILGLLAAGVSFVGILMVLYFRLFTDRSIPGFASVAIIILFLSGVQLVTLGAIGEYVGRVYDEVKQRPLFVIRERVGFEA